MRKKYPTNHLVTDIIATLTFFCFLTIVYPPSPDVVVLATILLWQYVCGIVLLFLLPRQVYLLMEDGTLQYRVGFVTQRVSISEIVCVTTNSVWYPFRTMRIVYRDTKAVEQKLTVPVILFRKRVLEQLKTDLTKMNQEIVLSNTHSRNLSTSRTGVLRFTSYSVLGALILWSLYYAGIWLTGLPLLIQRVIM